MKIVRSAWCISVNKTHPEAFSMAAREDAS